MPLGIIADLYLAEAFEALGDLEKRHNHCYFRGQPCWKVKRAVEDITLANEALDNYSGNATLDKRHNHCYFRGQPCWKVKRAVEVVEEATPADKAADKTAAVGTSPIIPETVAAVEQLMEENFTDNPVLEKRHNHCYFRGQPCWKAKRAIESFEEK